MNSSTDIYPQAIKQFNAENILDVLINYLNAKYGSPKIKKVKDIRELLVALETPELKPYAENVINSMERPGSFKEINVFGWYLRNTDGKMFSIEMHKSYDEDSIYFSCLEGNKAILVCSFTQDVRIILNILNAFKII